MADRVHSDTQEKVESIFYTPELKNSGDLEGATNTITATSKPGAADYTTNLTIPAPADPRLEVARLALRGNIHIDSFGGGPAATKLYATIECNGVEKITAEELTATGADNFFAVDLTSDFNLGSANELKIYLWVDQGDAVISECRLWLAVGSSALSGQAKIVMRVRHDGLIAYAHRQYVEGTGNPWTYLGWQLGGLPEQYLHIASKSGADQEFQVPAILVKDIVVHCHGSVSTSVTYVRWVRLTLRSGQ
ncbi:MAG: hypothetical protein V3S51_04620 [Dehalococcoidia bacterium]